MQLAGGDDAGLTPSEGGDASVDRLTRGRNGARVEVEVAGRRGSAAGLPLTVWPSLASVRVTFAGHTPRMAARA